MVTIKDIGKSVGVSTASVSKVLNGDYSGVSETTRENILMTAKAMKYRPNRLARSLVKNQSRIIGLIVPDISNPYYADLSKGVEEAASELNFNLILCNASDSSAKEYNYVNMLIEYNAAGVILTSMISYNEKSDSALSEYGIPFVALDRMATSALTSYLCNSFQGTFMTTSYLINSLGHRNIAFIGGDGGTGLAEEPGLRLSGYQNALQTSGIPLKPALVHSGSYHMETGYSCTGELLNSGQPFTAIVCANDLIAFGAIKALREKKIRVPEDISVTGYDDIILSSFMEPRLTTIRQDSYSIGRTLCQELLSNKESSPDRVVRYVQPDLVIRDSTGPAHP